MLENLRHFYLFVYCYKSVILDGHPIKKIPFQNRDSGWALLILKAKMHEYFDFFYSIPTEMEIIWSNLFVQLFRCSHIDGAAK